MFTLRIAHEGTWVFLSHPDAVKQVFTGDPRLLHAGEANIVLLPVLGSNSVLLLDDDAHMAQRKLMLPPFHGERMRGYERTMAEVAAREIERWPAGEPLRGVAGDAGDHARGDHPDRLRRARLGPARAARLDAPRQPRPGRPSPRRMASLGAARAAPRSPSAARSGARSSPTDELIYEEIRARRDAPTWRSATTCCRCSFRPGTRTAARCRTRSCATS